jgi:hypothetical protein
MGETQNSAFPPVVMPRDTGAKITIGQIQVPINTLIGTSFPLSPHLDPRDAIGYSIF